MTKQPAALRFSILDTAPIVQGSNAKTALLECIELARFVDRLGYHRFWVPEHHGMRGVASAAPAVVIDRVASVTRHLRVGAGGVMTPNHSPIVIAEQFGTLEVFHPGRIDLGLGRALGGPREVADRIRSPHERAAVPFAEQIRDLLGMFAPTTEGRVVAVPAQGSRPEIWMLGSSDYTARVAGVLGLPFVAAHHLEPGNAIAATRVYRQTFQPSPLCPGPRVMVSVSAIAADSDERAQWLSGSLRMKTARRKEGQPIRLPSPQTADHYGYAAGRDIADELDGVFVGAAATVLSQLHDLAEATDAEELLIKTDLYDPNDRRKSFELLAAGLAGTVGR
ncbi:LLM class flavin-dependent oxidoreductase [Nocardia sp. MDA0666]|uniref:LLM class flavin-dependent oxidoreductase n=1 Tax=Nocardia sp. MDA0666 TaxID=2135448 RepID=UPI000D11B28F|nr:LLM class flavin-dependent oxidoreductase [Nocardia sp. MDA0666]PSR70212.1 LLM class flavin-dependent oxidoreductase [Nocardia sp. MDA0666]